MTRLASILAISLSLSCFASCGRQPPTPSLAFEPNLVHAYKYEIRERIPMQQVLQDANWAVEQIFGTAEAPRIPEFIGQDPELSGIVQEDRLLEAQALYNKHQCVTCHGQTGNGRGETAGLLNPYPRDYRMGVFKFKSTRRNSKPTRSDLAGLIRHGIAGTTMNAIEKLSDQETDLLVDYVIYLSWRGEVERAIIDEVLEVDVAEGERVIDPSGKNTSDAEKKEAFDEAWEVVEVSAIEIAEAWLDAEDYVVEVTLPTDIPLPADGAEYREWLQGDQRDSLLASTQRGKELFSGKIAACNKCHGDLGKGDGQTVDYDDWTKDWTTRIGLKPDNPDDTIPFMARGALPPHTINPRNFAEGVFRGGATPEDLYRRITVGIAGTPMPAITFVEGELESDDVWHLINFIRSLEEPPTEEEEPPTEEDVAEPTEATT